MADSGGGSDWEVVSLTASTYAAAPGPIPIPIPPIHAAAAPGPIPIPIPPIHAAADKTESPLLLLPNPPSPPAHLFMSQHFNLPPLLGTHLENNKGGQELQESGPAAAVPDGDDADHLNLNTPRPQDGGRDDLQVEGGGGGGGGDEAQQTTTVIRSLPDATAAAGSDADGSASLPAPAAMETVSVPPSGGVVPCKSCNAAQAQAQAWWEKTFSFPRQDGNGNGNGGTHSLLSFRFVFVAGKLQIQEDHLHLSGPVPEFGQTQKIGCAAIEPLGQVKVSMLGGGGPVSQQG